MEASILDEIGGVSTLLVLYWEGVGLERQSTEQSKVSGHVGSPIVEERNSEGPCS